MVKLLYFPIADGKVKLSGGDKVLRTSNYIYRYHVEPRVKLHVPRESLPIPLRYIDGPRSTSTTWMLCLNAALTIIGVSKGIEVYQMRGRVSHGSPYWMKKTQMGIHGSGDS